jgi:hypothetical protein
MNSEARQDALRRHGLTETQDGFELTAEGFRKASTRALDLRKRGDPEAERMLVLSPEDPRRWEYARCIQIDAYTAEVHQSGI